MADEALVRLVNVYELLITARRPLTQSEICDHVPGFPASPAARARAFERAKASLRALGVPLTTTTLPGRSQVGYAIDPADALIEVRLSGSERRALSSALGSISLVGDRMSGLTGLLGLVQAARAPLLVDVRGLDRLPPEVAEAVARRRYVEFDYRDRHRRVAPLGIVLRLGSAYLVAREGGQIKTFRVERVAPPFAIGEPHGEEPRTHLGELLVTRPWQLRRSPPIVVVLEGEPEHLTDLGAQPGREGTAEIEVTNLEGLVAEVIRVAPAVRILSPAAVVDALERHLDHVASSLRAAPPTAAVAPAQPGARRPSDGRTMSPLETRFVLLTRALAFLAQRGGPVALSDLAGVVGLSEASVADLLESAALTGTPPYTPDALLEVLVDRDEGTAELLGGSDLSATMRVGVLEGMGVLAGMELVTRVCGDDPPVLADAIDRLRAAIAAHLPAMPALESEAALPDDAVVLVRAAMEGACVEFRYRGSSASAEDRHVRPVQLFSVGGVWYLLALRDHERRHYRVDRIRELHVVPTDGCHDPSEVQAAGAALDRGDPIGLRTRGRPQRVRVPAERRWVLERFAPGAYEELGDDEVQVFSLDDRWLARLLVALGPEVSAPVPVAVREAALELTRQLRALHTSTPGGEPRCRE